MLGYEQAGRLMNCSPKGLVEDTVTVGFATLM